MRRWRWPVRGAAAAGTLAAALAFAGGTTAQEAASPMASPPMAECAPLAVEAVETAGGASPTAAASPATAEEVIDVALGTPAADEIAERVEAAARNVVACLNAGDLEALSTLVAPPVLEDRFGLPATSEGMATPAPAVGASTFPPIDVTDLGDAQTFPDGRVGIDIGYRLGPTQTVGERWFFSPAEGRALVLTEVEDRPVEIVGDSAVISFSATPDAPLQFDQQTEIPLQDVMIFYGTNATDRTITFVAVRLPGEAEATPAPEQGLPADAAVVGRLTLAAGEQGQIVLPDLEPGLYAIANADASEIATIRITDPAA